MKLALRISFFIRLHLRVTLWLDIPSQAAGLPEQADFYRWAWQTLKSDYRHAQIGIMLCDEAKARALNRDYRGKDYATNVLSFALNEGEALHHAVSGSLTGDIVFCPQVVAQEAAAQGKTLMQHYAHLTVHGVLHLMGYDHIDEAEAEAMEALEIRILNQLGYADPYLEDPS